MKYKIKKLLFTVLFIFPFVSFSQWNPNPAINTPVCIAANVQKEIKIMEDGKKGGAFVLWRDYRDFGTSPDIYIQRVNAAGFSLWNPNGLAICTNFSDQSTPDMCDDTCGGVIATWSDWRSGIERDVYAQRIDSNGVILWTTDGVIVSDKPNREHCPRIIADGAGGAIIVWEQQDTFTWLWDVWAQRINSSGAIVWPWGGIPVCTYSANRINAKIQSDKLGGAFITWQDFRNGVDYDIYAQHLDANGNRLWGGNGAAVCTATGAQTSAKVDRDSISGGIYTTWVDDRIGSNYDIYAQRLDLSGTPLWAANGVAVCTAPTNQSAQDMMSTAEINGLLVTWKDHRNGVDIDVYAQKLNPAGVAQWAVNGVPVCTAINDQINPNITSDGSDGAIICWEDDRTTSPTSDIYSQKLDGNGVIQWAPDGIEIGIAANKQAEPKNCSDGSGGSIYAFQDRRNGTDYDVYIHHISGCISTPTATATPTNICVGDTASLLASNGTAYAWSPSTGLSCTNCANPDAYPITTTTYTVTVTGTCGTATATVTVNVSSPGVLTPTITATYSTICAGDTTNLNVATVGTYVWSPATNLSCTNCANPIANPSSTITYTVTVTGACSVGTDDITITIAQPPVLSHISDTSVCVPHGVLLTASGATSYSWSPSTGLSCLNCASTFASPSIATTYYVIGSNGPGVGCKDRDTVTVSITEDCPEIYIPNGFSPNGDGNNDVFQIFGDLKSIDLSVYNRWGQIVFKGNDQSIGWDGTFKGKDLESGVYAFTLSIVDLKGIVTLKTGNITLMR